MNLPAKQLTWNGRTPISTFVHSLHLLDLDLLEDWPGISKETLSSKSNLQHRMRCVEWSLYRLFEQFDPRLTKEKLLPFFPPTTSLQSINLRAALFRQLNELKKDGRLGQNVILRKTMLDECKGDKFEELLAAFSILVLKRTKRLSANGYDVSSTLPEHLLPLIISQRKVIEQNLIKRRELRLKAQRQQNLLQKSLTALTVEESEIKQRKAPKLPDNADSLRRILRENWIGDVDWVDTIINGELPDTLLSIGSASDEMEDDNTLNLLHDLSSRVLAHNVRLAHWQKCLKDLLPNQGPDQVCGNREVGMKRENVPRFSQHQDLNSMLESDDVQEIALTPQHITLFESLEKELTRPKNDPTKILARTEEKDGLGNARAFNDTKDPEVVVGKEALIIEIPEVLSIGFECRRDPYSQNTEHHAVSEFRVASAEEKMEEPITPPQSIQGGSSLLERTKASLAHLAIPEAQKSTERPTGPPVEVVKQTIVVAPFEKQPNRSSLLERTRESILLTSAFEDTLPRRKSGARKSLHSKSKSVNVPSQSRRRERTWSEESLASISAKGDLDVNADYESVFKSRPKLAMSPNLSPQRNDLFDEFLEEGMKKLTIEPKS